MDREFALRAIVPQTGQLRITEARFEATILANVNNAHPSDGCTRQITVVSSGGSSGRKRVGGNNGYTEASSEVTVRVGPDETVQWSASAFGGGCPGAPLNYAVVLVSLFLSA